LTTFIDHRHKRAGVSCPGRPQGVRDGRLPRAVKPRFVEPITDQCRQKRCSTTPARTRALKSGRGRRQKDQPISRGPGGPQSNRRVSWRFILQINLEPQFIHLSKSKLRRDDTPPNGRGSSR